MCRGPENLLIEPPATYLFIRTLDICPDTVSVRIYSKIPAPKIGLHLLCKTKNVKFLKTIINQYSMPLRSIAKKNIYIYIYIFLIFKLFVTFDCMNRLATSRPATSVRSRRTRRVCHDPATSTCNASLCTPTCWP